MDEEMQPRLERLTDAQLHRAAADFVAGSDIVYKRFHEWCKAIVEEAEDRNQGSHHE